MKQTRPIKKLLIANRGEISCRIIKTARKMGIATVAVYSDADANALHVKMADEAVRLGPAPSRESYLKGELIIAAAIKLGVDAIHPGYGFLSENSQFCKLCEQHDIIFVGPPVPAIEAMGSKSAAKQIMQKAGVPLVPGYHGEDQSADLLKQHADDMGYPVLLKAAAGGGGKGMRQVAASNEFFAALDAAKREAMSSFSDDIMLVEKYLADPRHVEIQVFCDNHGNGVYLFERDCSVQRRHQKVIEEAPAPGMTEALRAQMGEAALKAAHAIKYVGAGTVEFLLEPDGQFFFMEMNTRLQVEHPVTEMITQQDLVEWQIKVAQNEILPCEQSDLQIHGHAFEARVYAEDPNNDFLPSTGKLIKLVPPTESQHVRVDTGVLQGDDVSPYYDPMIAKLIVWDADRATALARLAGALSDYHVDGVTTNIDFLYNLASHEAFQQEKLTTHFIERHESSLFLSDLSSTETMVPIATAFLIMRRQSENQSKDLVNSPWQASNHWRMNESHLEKLELLIQGISISVKVEHLGRLDHTRHSLKIFVDNKEYVCVCELSKDVMNINLNGHNQQIKWVERTEHATLFTEQMAVTCAIQAPDLGLEDVDDHHGGFNAPMNGTIVGLLVDVDQLVEKGDTLMVMEAMKMEHAIKAPNKGKVTEFYFSAGDLVDGGAQLLAFELQE
ncbi:MAG: acetyl/propionyl/methylcrotonyl-CoA carboxylase subunit alpha [Aliiglaciecola sp.]